MRVLALLRRSVLGVCVLAPFAAVAVACTSSDADDDPTTNDAGSSSGDTGPSLTDPDTGSPGTDAGNDSGPAKTEAGTDAGDGGSSGTLPSGVVHQLSYHQLTTKAEHGSSVKPAISRNGNTIAWSTHDGSGINRVYALDPAAGGEPKLVDTYPLSSGGNAFVAVSDDGNIIASTDGLTIRVADKAAVAKGSLVFTDGEVSNISLNSSGTELYLVQRRDNHFPATPGATILRGLYKWAPGAAAISPLVTADDVATLTGKTVDKVFPFATCGGSGPGYSGLASSADGSKIYVGVKVDGAELVVGTSNAGGAAKLILPAVSDGGKFVNAIATNASGSKVAVNYTNTSAQGAGLDVINADGTGRKKVGDVTPSCGTPLSLGADGNTINAGNTGFVHHADGSDTIEILAGTGTYTTPFFLLGEPSGHESESMTMSGDGKRFAYLSQESGGGTPYHIAVAELDSRTLGSVPTVSEPHLSASSVPRDNGVTNVFASATVVGASPFVGSVMFNKGIIESQSLSNGAAGFLDDGKKNDKTAGDGIFTSPGDFRAYTAATPGPRVVRIKAELKDAAGKRQAHALDFGPFAVK